MFIHKISTPGVNGKHPWILKKKTNKKCVVILKKKCGKTIENVSLKLGNSLLCNLGVM